MTNCNSRGARPQAAEPPHAVPGGNDADIYADVQAWDEGLLGRDERFVEVADPSHELALDRAINKLA